MLLHIFLRTFASVLRNIGDAAKIEKAIRLSQEKYCGVGLMMKKIGPITYDILLNGEPLKPQKHED